MNRDLLFTTLAQLGTPRAFNRLKRVAGLGTIVCLHRVSDEPDVAWPPMSIASFDAFLGYLAARFDVVSLARFREPAPRFAKPRLVLTFDDGYADFVENALPLLRRHGLPSVHSVVVDCVDSGTPIWTQRLNHLCAELCRREPPGEISIAGETMRLDSTVTDVPGVSTRAMRALFSLSQTDRLAVLDDLERRHEVSSPRVRMMGWDDLRACQQHGVEIGSHSMSHTLLVGLPAAALEHEVAGSRRRLAEQLDRPVDTIAFPNGGFDDATVEASRNAGYRNLLTVEDRFIPRDAVRRDLLPRILIDHPGHLENIFETEGFHGAARKARGLVRRLRDRRASH